ncbi:MAG: protein kinase, partial [Myxococcales bacterium]|nr:protein kinase [Myxococcales bacterium]
MAEYLFVSSFGLRPVGADDEIAALAERHGVDARVLRELATLVASTIGGDASRTRTPDPAMGPTSDPSVPPVASDGIAQKASMPWVAVAEVPVTERYEVLDRLGQGGQGDVYRVFDHKMERALAMKVLRAGATAVAGIRFRTETRITIGLAHPGIVPVYDRGVTAEGRPWYTMEILEGAELTDLIADAEQPLRRLVDLFTRACEAVAYAHEQGVIHR